MVARPGGRLSAAWTGCTASAAAYEKALLDKLGALKAEEAERLQRAALVDGALSSLNELLPPMVARANKVDKSAAAAAEVAKKAEAELLPWVKEARERLEGKVDGLTESKGVRKRRSQANSGGHEGRRRGVQHAGVRGHRETSQDGSVLRAQGGGQRRRRGRLAPEVRGHRLARPCGGGDPRSDRRGEWKALEEAEAKLRVLVWKFTIHAQACGALWERLRRGCQRVGEWLTIEKPALTEDRSTSENEGQAILCAGRGAVDVRRGGGAEDGRGRAPYSAAKLNAMNSEYAARIKGARWRGCLRCRAWCRRSRPRSSVSRSRGVAHRRSSGKERLTLARRWRRRSSCVDQAIERSPSRSRSTWRRAAAHPTAHATRRSRSRPRARRGMRSRSPRS